MNRLAQRILQWRAWILSGTLLLTLFFAYQLTHIRVNSDILANLNPDDPAVVLFNRIGETYAGTELALVGLEADDVFTYETLQTIHQLTQAFSRIPGVASVMSLTDILDIRSVEGGLEVGRLIDKHRIPRDPRTLRQIREYTLSRDMYRGRIVSPDGRITIIINRLQQRANKQQVATEIQRIARELAPGYRLYFSGLPMQMIEINQIIIRDMIQLIPVVVIMLVGMLYFSFRTLRGVLLPLTTVLISTVWAMGLMAFLGIELSIISNIMPVILIAIGSAYGIHMIARYKEKVRDCPDKSRCVQQALAEVGVPILLAGVTTLIGFFSFAGSYLTSVTHFGIFTGIGVAFALVISLTVIPSVLSYLPLPRVITQSSQREDHLLIRLMDRLAIWVVHWKKGIVWGSVILMVVALWGLPRLHREVNIMEYFPEDTDIRIAEKMMEIHFGGSTPIQIVVQGDLKHPAVLKEMRRLERFLKTVPYVSQPQSVADLICEMNRVMNHHYTIPATRDQVANLWFFIESEPIMVQLVNADASEGIIQANLGTMDTKKILQTVNRINAYLEHRLDSVRVMVPTNALRQEAARRWIFQRIRENILWEVAWRDAGAVVDTLALDRAIAAVWERPRVSFPPDRLEKISRDLMFFFEEDAEIEIVDSWRIRKITTRIIDYLRNGQVVPQETLVAWIRQYAGAVAREDPEAVTETAYSLSRMLEEFVEYQRIQQAVEQILPLFPGVLQRDRSFREALRDCLWLLNDDWIALPQELANQLGMAGEPVRLRMIQSGLPTIFVRLDQSLLKSQIQSLAIAFGLVALILMFQLRSITGGLMAISPIAITVLFNFALMAYLDVPLDNATMMIASIAIGIGIDYAIHFTSRFKMELERQPTSVEALEQTLTTTGRAILINALSVALGFIILVFARLIPIQRFGWLTATTMLFSAGGAILFLPALILLTRARFVGRQVVHNKAEVISAPSVSSNPKQEGGSS
ncbi:MAG: RND family transporter [Calditrichaeota bacterium]|nr:RND family transporter [Calditrichota bacterium]